MIMGVLAPDEALHRRHLSIRRDGFVTDPNVTSEQLKTSADEWYSIDAGRNEHIATELRNFDGILRTVAGRSWSLLIARGAAPDFITCDHPVDLHRKQILFTLGRRHALVGSFTSALPRTAKVLPRAVQGDVSKPADIAKLFAETKKAYGKLDILVNNAGIYEFLPLEAITPEHFHKQFDLNVLGLLLTTQEAVKLIGRTAARSST